ncbi:hypothetical protein SPRG_05160 [Saprolegnia parasitica CBS 223.65]|uniref:AN1-type domain-containing protein n=1 Tax=Saprolegnia parasitica (strain CBS 223.65) TaxID=695850 RepID=A0A067CL79_SAPPC|nr:hypothetical protein SPRG_05160 [Saprolegnia parasitica CBS 223.65]KDO29970.1 hypothetical protein SPRG_05160 [Saprolegnia parasitica CBS 223.65]|eukprot:XP_012199154.1 hypothetical protein SPRG_05160 [Saprolegnia parasitica CBS 223.65]
MQNSSGILPTSSSSTPAAEPAPVGPALERCHALTPEAPKPLAKAVEVTPLEAATALATETPQEPEKPSKVEQSNKRKCWSCKAKIGLSAITCRCGYTFCTRHRYAEEHNCTFDFRRQAKRKLEEENPLVVPMKVARIN